MEILSEQKKQSIDVFRFRIKWPKVLKPHRYFENGKCGESSLRLSQSCFRRITFSEKWIFSNQLKISQSTSGFLTMISYRPQSHLYCTQIDLNIFPTALWPREQTVSPTPLPKWHLTKAALADSKLLRWRRSSSCAFFPKKKNMNDFLRVVCIYIYYIRFMNGLLGVWCC